MGRAPRVKSLVPWMIPESDVNPAESGQYSRDLLVLGQSQRQLALQVIGTYDASLTLGLVAIRCERKGDTLIPLTLQIADTPIELPKKPTLDVTLLSAPVRRIVLDEDGD